MSMQNYVGIAIIVLCLACAIDTTVMLITKIRNK
jgi:hypothetical protein